MLARGMAGPAAVSAAAGPDPAFLPSDPRMPFGSGDVVSPQRAQRANQPHVQTEGQHRPTPAFRTTSALGQGPKQALGWDPRLESWAGDVGEVRGRWAGPGQLRLQSCEPAALKGGSLGDSVHRPGDMRAVQILGVPKSSESEAPACVLRALQVLRRPRGLCPSVLSPRCCTRRGCGPSGQLTWAGVSSSLTPAAWGGTDRPTGRPV